MKSDSVQTYAGFVAVLGRTNVGKSTLINALVGEKVSIITDRPQTTTLLVRAILTEGNRQAVFVDTPGLHTPRNKFSKMLMGDIVKALEDVELVLVLVEPEDRMRGGTRRLISLIKRVNCPRFLLINKVDLAKKRSLLPTAECLGCEVEFDLILPISAKYGDGLSYLKERILQAMPPNPFFYPEDMVSDIPQTLFVAELVREKAMQLTHQEVPHCIAVETTSIREREDGAYEVEVVIYVERESLKGILIGKGGRMIRQIGTLARKELEEVTGRKIVLKTQVKVLKNWRNLDIAKKFRPS
ncbi:MAG: GTPase Era [Planctomycetota bacterium]|nr:MAG: GTPase Era [Planctomycetota bacterium]